MKFVTATVAAGCLLVLSGCSTYNDIADYLSFSKKAEEPDQTAAAPSTEPATAMNEPDGGETAATAEADRALTGAEPAAPAPAPVEPVAAEPVPAMETARAEPAPEPPARPQAAPAVEDKGASNPPPARPASVRRQPAPEPAREAETAAEPAPVQAAAEPEPVREPETAPAPQPEPTQDDIYNAIVRDYRDDNTPAERRDILQRMEALAADGHTQAAIFAGNLYRQGYGVPVDQRKALEWYRKAAEAGDENAYLGLALAAEELDDHGGYSPEEVFDYMRRASEATPSSVAHIHLGSFYGEGFGVPRDVAKAEAEYRKAEELGATGVEAQIAELHADPQKPNFDPDKALALYRKAIADGNINVGFRVAHLVSGRVDGVEARPQVAAEALQPLVDEGDERAAFLQGRLYADPESAIFDAERARQILDQSESGPAATALADMYAADGPQQDLALAESYYLKSIERGEESSRYRLALMYLRNDDLADAKVRNVLAPLVEKGDERAAKLVNRIE